MKNGRYLIKKFIEKFVKICIFSILLIIGITFITGFYYERNIYFKLNNITVELGDKLPEEITNYITLITDSSNLMIESDVPLDKEGHTTIIGEFNYYLAYNDSFYKYSKLTDVKSKIIVIDTIKPIINIKNDIKFEYNSKLDINKIAECVDLSSCKMTIAEEIDTTKSGKYEVNITAKDYAGNISYAKTEITVLEKPKPVYHYPAYSGSVQGTNETNNEKNSLLTEEEKTELRNNIVAFAKQFVGNPYVYGGTSLTNGTDCSGFTMSIYANFGYSIPRVVEGQAYMGIPVSESQLLPGDLVVYYGHVGLYAGNGMMVHAATPQSGIVYAPVYAGYKTYRRIIY